jgi:DNA-binding NarL/FixJ family response regulator
MKKHIFLSNRLEPLPRWLEAFPEAIMKQPSATKRPKFCKAGSALIWLHVDSGVADLPGMLGDVLRAAPGCPIVVLSNVPSDAEGYLALQAGASGYINSLANAEILHQVALVVENGGIWVGRELKSRLLGAFRPLMPENESVDNLEMLSPRQREVAVAVAKGASNKEVARALAITERTVKAHLSSIFEHLGVRDRVQLALLVNRNPPHAPTLKYGTGP